VFFCVEQSSRIGMFVGNQAGQDDKKTIISVDVFRGVSCDGLPLRDQ
jgi:hypothetical protein